MKQGLIIQEVIEKRERYLLSITIVARTQKNKQDKIYNIPTTLPVWKRTKIGAGQLAMNQLIP